MKPAVKFVAIALLLAGGEFATFETSSAMPVASTTAASSPPIVRVVWPCGPGWHPNPWGRCVPNWGWGGGYYGWGHPWGWHPYGWGWHRWGWHRWGWHRWG